ncbi:hypothetical protein C0J52_15234 [Blattella germanica]|nr:hypothetical protein C0J52_15234 [Blattella germanica]
MVFKRLGLICIVLQNNGSVGKSLKNEVLENMAYMRRLGRLTVFNEENPRGQH